MLYPQWLQDHSKDAYAYGGFITDRGSPAVMGMPGVAVYSGVAPQTGLRKLGIDGWTPSNGSDWPAPDQFAERHLSAWTTYLRDFCTRRCPRESLASVSARRILRQNTCSALHRNLLRNQIGSELHTLPSRVASARRLP